MQGALVLCKAAERGLLELHITIAQKIKIKNPPSSPREAHLNHTFSSKLNQNVKLYSWLRKGVNSPKIRLLASPPSPSAPCPALLSTRWEIQDNYLLHPPVSVFMYKIPINEI